VDVDLSDRSPLAVSQRVQGSGLDGPRRPCQPPVAGVPESGGFVQKASGQTL